MGCAEENTSGAWFTLRDRPGVSVSDRGKRGPSGDMQRPADVDSLPLGALGGFFVVLGAFW